jgi:hypothetical protein
VGWTTEANSLQVRVELQADCLAGIWANRAQERWQFIEPGDVEAAMQTASAIGPRLCRSGCIHPRHVGAAHTLVHDGPEIR